MHTSIPIFVGAVTGAFLFGAGAGGRVMIGFALGALLGWCISLQQRLARLEHVGRRERQPSSAAPGSTSVLQSAAPEGLAGVERHWPSADSLSSTEIAKAAGPATMASASTPAILAAAPGATIDPSVGAGSAPKYHLPQRQPASRSVPQSGSVPWSGIDAAIDMLLKRAKEWLTTGNIPVKVGVVLSVFGVGFLVKEAIDRSWLVMPIEFRLLGVALFGAALLALGWRLRQSRPSYGLSLQGGGIAVLYVTIFAAFSVYSILPAGAAFTLLVLVTLAAGTLAVWQNAHALAVLGIIGGFMAPILASDGGGDHVLLFSYYAILNCAVFGIAWFRAWRTLNLLGFVFTFVIGSIWGYAAYEPRHFATTEPFLILFFLMYALIPLLFARRNEPKLRGFVDGTLVFGVPLIAFGLQTALIGDSRIDLAWSAAGLASFYAVTSLALFMRGSAQMRVIAEAYAGLGVGFATIAVPLALDAQSTSVVWAMQGAAMIWLGWRQSRRLELAAGILLQGLAAAAFLVANPSAFGTTPILNGAYLGAFVIAASAWCSAWVFDRFSDHSISRYHNQAAGALLLWGTGWWLWSGLSEIDRVLANDQQFNATLYLLSATILLGVAAHQFIRWNRAADFGMLLVPTIAIGTTVATVGFDHPFENGGWLSWAAVAAAHFIFLNRCEKHSERRGKFLHALGYCAFTLLLAVEAHWHLDRLLPGIFPEAVVLALITGWVFATVRMSERQLWPLSSHKDIYLAWGTGIVTGVAAIWMILLNATSPASSGAIPYVPLFNPLEIATVLFAAGALSYWRKLLALRPGLLGNLNLEGPALGALALFLLTMIVARSVHRYADVPFVLARLIDSDIFQAALSIIWGSAAIGAMIVGARKANRWVWLAGAALMGAVVIKLFIVELGNTGTVERVVSFLGVGILLLVVGYVAPVPPHVSRRVDSSDGNEGSGGNIGQVVPAPE
jgi:uncharacterized membrane protein